MPGNFRTGTAFPGTGALTETGTDVFSSRTDAVDTISSEVVNSLANSVVKVQKAVLDNQPMFALGDLVVGGVAGAPTRLGTGLEGQVLKIVTGVPQWAEQLDGGLVHLGYTATAADPTTGELPNDKEYSIHKNTTSGDVFLAYNDGGVIKKVLLS